MDSGLGLLKFLFPQLPGLANTAVWHTLGMTPTSDKWDLRTMLTVHVLRSFMTGGGWKPSPVGKMQATTLKDPGIKGKMWVAKATIPAPREGVEGVREEVFKAIDELKGGDVLYAKPGLEDVDVEWTGFRPNARKDEPLPNVSEEEKYKRLMAEPSRTSETTILYFHGGAYWLCSPATHRTLCSRLAKESKGRTCSVRYRLAPQTAFPGQLMDALMVYLSLLYPPAGSIHESVQAEHIVLGGDSAGGNLAFALLQLILHFHRSSNDPTIRFHGKAVQVPLPAGCTANSGWFDLCRAMPTIHSNAKFDYLPPPSHDERVSRFPADKIWPTNPPRGDLFCDLSLLDHPLASPLAADSWKGSPPLWIETGQEMLSEEDSILAAQAASQDVTVQFEEYEAMPHCFSMLLPALPTADSCMRSWGDFCRRCVEEPENVKTQGTYAYAKGGKTEQIVVSKASEITLEEAKKMMKLVKERRMEGYEKEGKTMPKPSL